MEIKEEIIFSKKIKWGNFNIHKSSLAQMPVSDIPFLTPCTKAEKAIETGTLFAASKMIE
jgi:hypothetical protein